MKVTGSATLAAPPPRVWDALRDPAVLARSIPGCHGLEALGDDAYKVTITAGVAAVKGTYVGRVALAEPKPPHSFVLRARGQGAPGTVEATVTVRLSEEAGGTRVDYDADAVVGGMLGGVGQRMLGSVARRTAGEFFSAVERQLTAPAPAPEPAFAPGEAPASEEAAARPETARVFPGRAAGPALAGAGPAGPMALAFGMGGLVALAGVVVGYALGRRRGAG
ncbi:SRPBCC family protein [Thermomonospora catenispora]|uniref:SRPBCC family protein n=1 Tax=Thermomonospora catenispora TaxID=2493090 RepID=UPI001120223B|nr:carbon monoxide dehydrogenase subunit G [Thermomonospora catenispora]TNY34981.1 carbon monoxide dehydrogenase [Thermomonospora catenispora]